MDPMVLMKEVQDALQETSDILGIHYPSATDDEKHLIWDMAPIAPHKLEWFLSIGKWTGSKELF